MRVQILPLPQKRLGDAIATPFVLVIDHCTDRTLDFLRNFPTVLEDLRDEVGAAAFLVGDLEDIEVPGVLELPPDLKRQLHVHLAKTLQEQ